MSKLSTILISINKYQSLRFILIIIIVVIEQSLQSVITRIIMLKDNNRINSISIRQNKLKESITIIQVIVITIHHQVM